MFATQFRSAAIALAGAALVATCLISPIAAAPDPAASFETGAKPRIDLANANVETKFSTLTANGANNITFKFRVKNYGPDLAKVKIEKQWSGLEASGAYITQPSTEVATLGPGDQVWVYAACQVTAPGHCSNAFVKATLMNGLDPDLSNNSDYYNYASP